MVEHFCEFDVDHGPMIEHVEGLGDVHTRDYRPCGAPAPFKIDMGNGGYFWACAFHHDEVNGDHGEGSFKVPKACFGRYNQSPDDGENAAQSPANGRANRI